MGKPGREPAGRRPNGASTAPAAGTPAAPMLTVRVWLYGALSQLCHERPLTVEFPPGIAVGDMIERLSRRVGPGLIDWTMESPSRKRNVCRIFLDGAPVGLDDRLPDAAASAEFEMIMLTAIEGG